jgi:hypothetical protein
VCLPAEIEVEDVQRFDAGCRRIDLSRAEAGRAEDKSRILSEVGGVDRKRIL